MLPSPRHRELTVLLALRARLFKKSAGQIHQISNKLVRLLVHYVDAVIPTPGTVLSGLAL